MTPAPHFDVKPFTPPKYPAPDPRNGRWKIIFSIPENPLNMWTEEAFKGRYFHTKWFKRRFMQVMQPELAEQILLRDRECFKKSYLQDRLLKPALGEGILTAEGEDWRRQRKAAAPAFQYAKLKAMVPVMDQAGRNAVQRLAGYQAEDPWRPVDLHQEMVRTTYDVIAETLLSNHDPDPHYTPAAIGRDVAIFLQTIGRFNFLDLFDVPNWVPRELASPGIRAGRSAIGRLRQFCKRQIAARKKDTAPRGDLLELLMTAHDPESGQGLTDRQLLDNVITFIGAGHETTAVALSWTLMVLSQNPDLQTAMFNEIIQITGDDPISPAHIDQLAFTHCVLKETMRLYPPVAIIPRSVIKPVTVAGVPLVPGDHVSIAIYPMHRHQTLWEDADVFNPARFLPAQERARHRFSYLPFGAGPRICIGMKFAMMEAVTILARLVREYEFTPAPEVTPSPQLSITLRPKGGMPLLVSKRA